VFLDEPFPANLPVVGTCEPCNLGASLDEEYVACLIEVGACGSAAPSDLERPRVRRAFERSSALAARLQAAFDPEGAFVTAEIDRVVRVVEKMARGLWAFELAEPPLDLSARVAFQPLHCLDDDARSQFEAIRPASISAEVGSRMMTRQALAIRAEGEEAAPSWQEVQPDRFRYAVEFDHANVLKLVVREYLAVEVRFA
jgi:hypothetical protein